MLSGFSRPLTVIPLLIGILFLVIPGAAFTADSLKITVKSNGDATAVFDYTLEGFIENAIPESMLKEELVKGLSTSQDPPEVIAFDKSEATLLLKNFAQLTTTPGGTEYLTGSLDFSKAEIALKESAVSSVITADFTPQSTTVIFPDGYNQVFTETSTLPPIRHLVIDPSKKDDVMTTIATPRQEMTKPKTVTGTTAATLSATDPVIHETTGIPATTVPSLGLPVTVTVLAMLGLAGAGTYYYAIRDE